MQHIKFNSDIIDVMNNRRVVVIALKEKFAVFDACTLEERFNVTSCYLSPGNTPNPISLGDRWIAYSDRKLVSIHRLLFILENL